MRYRLSQIKIYTVYTISYNAIQRYTGTQCTTQKLLKCKCKMHIMQGNFLLSIYRSNCVKQDSTTGTHDSTQARQAHRLAAKFS